MSADKSSPDGSALALVMEEPPGSLSPTKQPPDGSSKSSTPEEGQSIAAAISSLQVNEVRLNPNFAARIFFNYLTCLIVFL